MKRFIDDQLKQWKNKSRRKPLILRGARQVGKTWSVKQFGLKSFESVAYVDLERNPQWHRVFTTDLSAKRICAELEVLLGQKIAQGKSLLFIDEIQACPRAVASLRYFFEEIPDLHVIAAGSLLEFAMRDISIPVGRVQFMHLHPLCFAEYLEATGNSQAASLILKPPCTVSGAIHDLLSQELRRYFFIGGMPECVKAYKETASLQESFEVQAQICETYRLDFAKYTPQVDKTCINAVLTAVTQSVGSQIKYTHLAQGYANPTIKKAFDLLCLSNVVRKVAAADPGGLPLGATASAKIFKALLVDIGLMRYLSGMPVDVEYSQTDLLHIYRGAMAEQFVGQEMAVAQKGELYYWSRQQKSSSAEVDFLAVVNGAIRAVEVKSGSAGRLKSLHMLLQSYSSLPGGIVLSSRPYAELPDAKLTFIPLYFTFSATGGTGTFD